MRADCQATEREDKCRCAFGPSCKDRHESGAGIALASASMRSCASFTAWSARMFQAYNRHIAYNSLGQFAREWVDPLARILIRMPAA
jgi:hypothetical protein